MMSGMLSWWVQIGHRQSSCACAGSRAITRGKAEEAKAKTKTPIKPAIKEAPVTPRRLGLADLRAAAAARKQEAVA